MAPGALGDSSTADGAAVAPGNDGVSMKPPALPGDAVTHRWGDSSAKSPCNAGGFKNHSSRDV